MNLTPLSFFKKFGYETSRLYCKNIILIADYYSNWNVDKHELKEIVLHYELLKYTSIAEFEEFIKDSESDDELMEILYDNLPIVINRIRAKEILQTLKQLEK